MKPLTARQKDFLYREVAFGKYRFVAKPLYEFIMWLILAWERLLDFMALPDNANPNSLTIIIKTFERPHLLEQLMRSIRRKYPDVAVIVVNDSRKPYHIGGVHNIILPYDVGVSAGRNAALQQVKTPYFLLLDDDFVFSRRQNLNELVEQMDQHPEIDILGGRCVDLPIFAVHDFQDIPIHATRQPCIPIGTMIGENRVVDKVQNYFIARTDRVKQVGWNENLKNMEHTEFFTRAKGVLVTAYREDMLILHVKAPFDFAYMLKRRRA